MIFFVDVQHPEQGEFTRIFKTLDDAERYIIHMQEVRGYIASLRKEPDQVKGMASPEKEKWLRYQEKVRVSKGGHR